jgi:hypothetical protein
MVPKRENRKYENAISLYSEISRKKGEGFSIPVMQELLRVLEHFEEYEKCNDIKRNIEKKYESGKP